MVRLCAIQEGVIAPALLRTTGTHERLREGGDLPGGYPNGPKMGYGCSYAGSVSGGDAVCFALTSCRAAVKSLPGFFVEKRTGRELELAGSATKPKARNKQGS